MQLKAKYETLPGWKSETTGCRRWEDLPEKAREYVEFIEKKIGVPVTWIGTGPRREDMIQR
jgi:adenylosuccinate synthase